MLHVHDLAGFKPLVEAVELSGYSLRRLQEGGMFVVQFYVVSMQARAPAADS